MKNEKIPIIILIITISFCFSQDCPKSNPILTNGECTITSCSEEEFNNQTCIISNDITKIQWLNKIIINEEKNIYIIGTIINNNEIIISSIIYNTPLFVLYSLNNNNQLNAEYFTIYKNKNFSNSGYIQSLLIEINNKLDYHILSCFEDKCHLINYYNKEKELLFDVYDKSKNSFLFKLNDNYNHFYGSYINQGYLVVRKFNFSYLEEDNIIQVNFVNKTINEDINPDTKLSCFQTENDIIECMVFNRFKEIYIFLLDHETLNLIQKIKIDSVDRIYALKCIHLQKEIGIYNYFHQYKNPVLKIKNLKYNENNEEYQLIDIINDSITFITDNSNHGLLDEIELLRISNTRFVNVYIVHYEYLLILLCDLFGNENNLNNLIIRHYKILFDLYDIKYLFYSNGFICNNFIGFSFVNDKLHPLILVFGNYSNIEPDKNVSSDNINNRNNDDDNLFYNIKINDYFSSDIKLDNNLFGYEFIGIKIDNLTGRSSGIKYHLNANKNIIIKEKYVLNINDEITIDYSNVVTEINIDTVFYIELSELYGEADYDKFNSYADEIVKYGEEDPKLYFERQTFKGQPLKVKYKFGCYKSCDTCEYVGFTENNQKCTTCKNNEEFCYLRNINDNNCFNIFSSTYNYYNNNEALICVPLNKLCPDDYPFENKETRECKEIISFNELLSEKYIINNSKKSIDTLIELFYEQIKNKTVDISEEIIINLCDIIMHMTSTEKQKHYIEQGLNKNISSINLNECENILKSKHNIEGSLIILKIDIKS